MLIIPQMWVEGYMEAPEAWWTANARNILRVLPDIRRMVNLVAREVGVAEQLLITRMQVEQSAWTYAWDGSSRDYGGGSAGDQEKLRWLCGVDKTDTGPRPGAWEGPERQLLGCSLRFKYWYRGLDGPKPEWRNWLKLRESSEVGYAAGKPVIISNEMVTPSNQASADCLRYTPHLKAAEALRMWGERWFPADYIDEGKEVIPVSVPRPVIEDIGLKFKRQPGVRSTTRHLVVHHTAGSGDAAAIHASHLQRDNGTWAGIGYHAVIENNGRIVQGRPFSWVGAHAAPHNSTTIGIALVGNYDTGKPPERQLTPLTALLAWLCQEYKLPPAAIIGHRDLVATVCPGRHLYAELARIRTEVGRLLSGETSGPTTPKPPTEAEPTWKQVLEDAAGWAAENGISDGSRLTEPATRGEVLVMLRRFAEQRGGVE